MANDIGNNIAESFQNIFLAGVGALSVGSEKAKDIINDLVQRGKVTVEEGRKMNEKLKHDATNGANKVREETIRAYVRSLSPEERVAFAEQMAEIAREMEDESSVVDNVVVESEDVDDDDDVVVDAEGVYEGDDIDPVEHLKSDE